MALLILALLQRIFLMSSLMLLLVWLIFFMVLIKLLPILGTISGKTVKLMVLALICLEIGRAVQQECRDRDLHSFPTRRSSDLSGVVDIFHGIDKAVADTWNNFWKDGKADGIGSNLSRNLPSGFTPPPSYVFRAPNL